MMEAVIFDLDGTLINIPIDYDSLYTKLEKTTNVKKNKAITVFLQTLSKEERMKAFEIWTEEELQSLPKMTINEKGMNLYKAYSSKPLALVTMQSRETVRKVLQKLKLRFQHIITREDTLVRMAQLKMAIEKLKTDPSRVLVIGDRESDLRAALEVGCQFLRV